MMRDSVFVPEYKTNVLPLRWLADYIFHPISMWFFHIGVNSNDKLDYDYSSATLLDEIKEKVGFKVYNILNYPYKWWGTGYKLDLSDLNIDMSGTDWDDYDDQGHPYWDYWWHLDPETGDGWRLVSKV
jgi:hypothetical protein